MDHVLGASYENGSSCRAAKRGSEECPPLLLSVVPGFFWRSQSQPRRTFVPVLREHYAARAGTGSGTHKRDTVHSVHNKNHMWSHLNEGNNRNSFETLKQRRERQERRKNRTVRVCVCVCVSERIENNYNRNHSTLRSLQNPHLEHYRVFGLSEDGQKGKEDAPGGNHSPKNYLRKSHVLLVFTTDLLESVWSLHLPSLSLPWSSPACVCVWC